MWLRLTLLILVVALNGCASVPSERALAVNGVVFADDQRTATRTAELLDEMSARLDALDVGLVVRPLEVWLFAKLDDADIYGGYDAPRHRILLDAQRKHPAATLAHELVHAYEPLSWARLPAVVREGLADHLAARAVPEIAAQMRAARAVSLASYATGGLPISVEGPTGRISMTRLAVPISETTLSPLEALALPHGGIRAAGDGQTLKALYGMGLLIVSRAGRERLVEIAQNEGDGALVDPSLILAAARLSADKTTWLPAIEGLLQGREELDFARQMLGQPPLPQDDSNASDADVRD